MYQIIDDAIRAYYAKWCLLILRCRSHKVKNLSLVIIIVIDGGMISALGCFAKTIDESVSSDIDATLLA